MGARKLKETKKVVGINSDCCVLFTLRAIAPTPRRGQGRYWGFRLSERRGRGTQSRLDRKY